jgi:hypothetical protein
VLSTSIETISLASSWKEENGGSLLHHACKKVVLIYHVILVHFWSHGFQKAALVSIKMANTLTEILREAEPYKDHSGMLMLHHVAALSAVF